MGVALNLYGGATPSGVVGVNVTAERKIAKGYFDFFEIAAISNLSLYVKLTTTM